MFKGTQWFIERLVERLIPIIATSFSSTVETLHALGQAEQQSQLEEAARRYEADGKPEIAAVLRRRAIDLPSDNPASQAVDIYYQAVGNPLQTDRLPNRRPDLQLPYRPYSPTQDTWFALRLMGVFGLVSAAAMFAQMMHLFRTFGAESNSLLWTNSVLIGFGVLFILKAIHDRNTPWLELPLGCLLAAFLFLNLPLPFAGRLLLASVSLGVLAWFLGVHWATCCTASPLSRSTASGLQATWNGYLVLAALVPPGILLVLHFAPVGFTVTLVVTIVVFQVLSVAFMPTRRSRLRIVWQALVSWLTYNRRDADLPGIFRSVAGSWVQRMAMTGLCVFFLSATYVRIPLELPRSDSLPADVDPALARTAAAFPTAAFGGDSPSLDDLVVGLALIVFTLSVPLATTFVVPLVLSLPVLVQAGTFQKSDVAADAWRDLVDDLGRSVDPIERDSLFMGRVAHDGSPVLVPRKLLGEHAHFLGDSGAGKTSLGLAPLIEQLGSTGDCSIIAIDLKADSMELLGTLIAAAKKGEQRTGRTIPVKHFSNQCGRSTFAFNPLLQPYWTDLELYMRTDIQCGALGLTYGADYGEGYYSSANAAVLYHTMKTFPDVNTYKELAERVGYVVANAKRSELHPEIRKAGVHVQTVLDRLGSFEALNVTPDGNYSPKVIAEAIDFTKVFAHPEVHYFHLSSTLGPGSSPEIARLVTYSLLAAATQVKRRHQVFLVIDEFQRMVSRNIEYMLQLARSMGVGVILANQTMQDLRTSTADLIPAIEANCRYRQWFAVSSVEDRQRLVESSGQTVDLHITRSYGTGPNGNTKTVSYQERIVPRLSENDILLASDHPKQSIVRISRGDGYAQYGGMPFIAESDYHITLEQYEDRKSLCKQRTAGNRPAHLMSCSSPPSWPPIFTAVRPVTCRS